MTLGAAALLGLLFAPLGTLAAIVAMIVGHLPALIVCAWALAEPESPTRMSPCQRSRTDRPESSS